MAQAALWGQRLSGDTCHSPVSTLLPHFRPAQQLVCRRLSAPASLDMSSQANSYPPSSSSSCPEPQRTTGTGVDSTVLLMERSDPHPWSANLRRHRSAAGYDGRVGVCAESSLAIPAHRHLPSRSVG